MPTLQDVVSEARVWLNAPTPYQHQQRMKGVAVDCVGLVIGVARVLCIFRPDFDVKGYDRTPDGESLKAQCDEHLDRVSLPNARPGHLLLLRFAEEPQHMAIVADYIHGGLSMIHAYAKEKRVVEHRLADVWRARIVQAYSYRGLD